MQRLCLSLSQNISFPADDPSPQRDGESRHVKRSQMTTLVYASWLSVNYRSDFRPEGEPAPQPGGGVGALWALPGGWTDGKELAEGRMLS